MNEINEDWFRCQVEVDAAQVEVVANWLREQGCEGVQIEDVIIAFDESEDATITPREKPLVTGFGRGGEAERTALLGRERPFSQALEVTAVETRDWANEWRENFPPLHIGPFQVVPTWEEVVEESGLILRLDPGLAFGTGQHPTTHMCLELLPEVVSGNSGVRLLDVGCGSGILSIAAAKLGASVTASDLDAWCTQATQENAELNQVQVDVHLVADMNWVERPFPVVVANLMSDLLVRLAPDFARVTQPGGTLLVSGISAPRAEEVEKAITLAGFTTRLTRQMDGDVRGEGPDGYTERWAAFIFDRTQA